MSEATNTATQEQSYFNSVQGLPGRLRLHLDDGTCAVFTAPVKLTWATYAPGQRKKDKWVLVVYNETEASDTLKMVQACFETRDACYDFEAALGHPWEVAVGLSDLDPFGTNSRA